MSAKQTRGIIFIIAACIYGCVLGVISGCDRYDKSYKTNEHALAENADKGLERVLRVQQLYNLTPDENIVPQIETTIDSMRCEGRNPYYFAAINVLIDRLFSEGRFAEADSLAVRMYDEAEEEADSISITMAKRVRAQMFYKLAQPHRALNELNQVKGTIQDPFSSRANFGTSTSIHEWLWIICREIGDTLHMNEEGLAYADMVENLSRRNNWTDSTGHYPVSALAFKAAAALSDNNHSLAKEYIDSAGAYMIPTLPSRAYEHLYQVRCLARADEGNWLGAIADVDTLLSTHKEYPWFYLKDLLLKADILNRAGEYEKSANAYSDYIAFHDSLSNKITDRRLHDLTVLYRTEIDREQKRAERFKLFASGAVILFLLILFTITIVLAAKEKKKNRILVERLKELDRSADNTSHKEENVNDQATTDIERLDRFMATGQPYINPSLSRKELAELMGISQDAIGALIKNERGVSVKAYINSFRLEEARRVLGSDSVETIADMAERLGFGTPRTLQRAFKERYGMSPTQYREASNDLQNTDLQS